MARVALDAMGGDYAPKEAVAGAVAAADEGYDVLMVGREADLRPLLDEYGGDLPIRDASQVIGMADNPAAAIREMPDSSIVQAAKAVREGSANALVSAGSTGAALAASAIVIGRLQGVTRPAIATIWPTPGGPTVVLDSGANPDCRPEQLVQFAIMGTLLSEIHVGVVEPRVGLLTIGEEKGKGRDLERAAYDRLEVHPGVRFVGNVEGHDVAENKADVIVTDGFTGNVMLKTAEGVIKLMFEMFRDRLSQVDDAAREAFSDHFRSMTDALSTELAGGAHLMGVNGVVVISHGSSSRVAIKNAIAMAAEGAESGLVDRLDKHLAAM